MKKIIVISGFTENRFEHTGTYRLYKALVEDFGSDKVMLCEWDDNFAIIAELLRSEGVSEIVVGSYSWGAGNGLKQLSKYFTGPIKAILCDPVYRSKFPWMRWRALTNKFFAPTIKYPENVTVVRWFNQRVDKPSGHAVKAGKLLQKHPTTLKIGHSKIDDSASYFQAVFAEAALFLR